MTAEIRDMAHELARQVLVPDEEAKAIDDQIDRLMHAVVAEACPGVLSEQALPGRFGIDYRIRQAVRIIRAAPSKTLDVDCLAGEVGLSRSHFHERFRACTGISPGLYIDALCCDWAAQQLCDCTRSIATISSDLGFASQSHFSRFFKSKTGVSPRDFRRAHASVRLL